MGQYSSAFSYVTRYMHDIFNHNRSADELIILKLGSDMRAGSKHLLEVILKLYINF